MPVPGRLVAGQVAVPASRLGCILLGAERSVRGLWCVLWLADGQAGKQAGRQGHRRRRTRPMEAAHQLL